MKPADDALEEQMKLNRQIASQWKTFSKTEAFRQLMEYIELQDYLAIKAAKGPVMPFGGKDGEELVFDSEKSANLLQRSVGYDIVKEYVEGFVNLET